MPSLESLLEVFFRELHDSLLLKLSAEGLRIATICATNINEAQTAYGIAARTHPQATSSVQPSQQMRVE